MEEKEEEGNEGRMCAKRFFSVVDRDRYGRIVRSTEKSLLTLLTGEICNSGSEQLENNILRDKNVAPKNKPVRIFSPDSA